MRITAVTLFCLMVANVPSMLSEVTAQQVKTEGRYSIFEEYNSTMNGEQIKTRLDGLAELLKINPFLRAYIMSYGGKRSCRNEAVLRSRAAERYLSNIKGIDSIRLTIRNGGYRDNWSVELWVGNTGAKPPPRMRVIGKGQVTIVGNCDPALINIHNKHPGNQKPLAFKPMTNRMHEQLALRQSHPAYRKLELL